MKRPKFLTFWLSLMTISILFSLYGDFSKSSSLPKMQLPNWYFALSPILLIVQLFAVFLLWNWKKVGFYIVVGLAIIAASINGAIFGLLGVGLSVVGILGVLILFLAMKPVWNKFK